MNYIGFLIISLILFTPILIITLSKPLNLNKYKYIQLFFALFLISSIINVFSYLTTNSGLLGLIGSYFSFLAFGLVLIHSSIVHGTKKTALFFLIAFSFGLFSEALGIKYGLIYGSYYYNYSSFFFGLVPFATPISWAIVIYFSYTITNLLLSGFKGEKPKKSDNWLYLMGLLVLLSSIDGLIAVNLDMILDPVAVFPLNPGWVWIGGGPYFGIPISNFIGWFSVTFVATLLFRFYESFYPREYKIQSIDLYIPFVYLMYFLINAAKAIEIGKTEYVLIGVATMCPFILIAFLTFIVKSKKERVITS